MTEIENMRIKILGLIMINFGLLMLIIMTYILWAVVTK